jgi:hypothetical protein
MEQNVNTTEVAPALARLFGELVHGTTGRGEAFVLNTGDIGPREHLTSIRSRIVACCGTRHKAHPTSSAE